jgi:hypothetical protein
VPGASDEAVACDAGPGRKLPAERQVSSLLRNVTQQHCDDFVSHTQNGTVFPETAPPPPRRHNGPGRTRPSARVAEAKTFLGQNRVAPSGKVGVADS